ncbi:MAG TPA: efflux RND transporter periplasmic adaptor subunit [Pirellulales bacterium]|nr:efflux RND transporter periplasmic adaptor subunit [Pirellulales bacterium]
MADRDYVRHRNTAMIYDEGGLRAPPGLTGWRKAWWWFDFIILVKLARLRFVAVLVLIGVIITQWDLLTAYYQRWTRDTDSASAAASDVEWFCPMHPSVVRDNGKEKCPVCFMPLSKRKKGEAHEEVLPAGIVNRVQLSPYRVVLAGVQTWQLDYRPLSKQIKAAGFIEFDERGQRTVSARIGGRIDKLFANETGQMVEANAALASIYSPDLVVTVQNLIDARKSGNAKNLESVQKRLELLGIDDAQIKELAGGDTPKLDLVIRSPISGHVIKKFVREGQYVEQGTPLYEVADLSTVWLQAQVYEDDMEFLPLDQQHPGALRAGGMLDVSATTRAFPNDVFHGKLNFVYPHVDPNTRTVTIRCELDNPGHKLRPGSTASVVLSLAPKNVASLVAATQADPEQASKLQEGEMLAVPENAVIDTGAQRIVYRETIPGTFEGVRVKLGPRMAGPEGEELYPVLGGLARGERIVASGSFLVDAETRLNPAAGSVYFGGSAGSNQRTSSNVRPSTPDDEEAKLAAAFKTMSAGDQLLAMAQQFCPVLESNRLGSMGTPVKLTIDGQTVFLCCDGCKKSALANPKGTLAKVAALVKKQGPAATTDSAMDEGKNDPIETEIETELAKLSDSDRKAAQAQKFCVILPDSRLGSMGKPEKLAIGGKVVFVCCEGCSAEALAHPERTLAKAAELRASTQKR